MISIHVELYSLGCFLFFSFFFHIGTQKEAVVEEEILDVFYTLEEH